MNLNYFTGIIHYFNDKAFNVETIQCITYCVLSIIY